MKIVSSYTYLPCKNYISNVKNTKRTCMLSSYVTTFSSGVSYNFSKQGISFGSKITKIKSEDEYNQVIKRIKNSKTIDGKKFWLVPDEYSEYAETENKYIGLLPYCGTNDKSQAINRYLSGRLNVKNLNVERLNIPKDEKIMIDFIRALDYSLDELDKEFGKYQGIVYRQGFMDENMKQYVSATIDPKIAGQLKGQWSKPNFENGFSVIKVKNGHNIFEFQKKMDAFFADLEKEIVLPRNSKFKLIQPEDLSTELRNAKLNMASMSMQGAYKLVNKKQKTVFGFSLQNILDSIKVYVEQ